MTKKIVVFLAGCLLLISGMACSPRGWTARWYIVQAENAHGRAGQMKDHKAAFEERFPWYAKACHYYIRAYETDPEVFTLIRIEEAADCCWKANLRNEEARFREFEEAYSTAHPQEVEHGDAGVGMIEMG